MFAGTNPAHRSGMKTLVAADDGHRPYVGQRVDVEQRRYHGRGLPTGEPASGQ
jgi:hypothetical protein